MHRYLYLVYLLLTGFAVSAPASSLKSVLVVGDSLSASYGFELEQGWVSLLQKRLSERGYGYLVVNASISGETTSGALSRLPTALKQHQPQIVIIELGGNDGLRGISLTEMRSNLERMVRLCKEQVAKVLLLGVRLPPNYGPVYSERFHAVYQSVTEQSGVEYLPMFMEGVAENRELMQADGIHPTREAQILLLENVWSHIEAMLQR